MVNHPLDLSILSSVPVEESVFHSGFPITQLQGTIPRLQGFPCFNHYYHKLAQLCRKEAAANTEAGTLNITYHKNQPAPTLLSVTVSVIRQNGKRNSMLFFDGCVWDCRSGFPAPLSAFTSASTHEIRQFLIERTEAQIKNEGLFCFPNWKDKIQTYWYNGQFYLEDQKIILYFPPCIIAPAYEGTICYFLPETMYRRSFLI